MHQINLSDQLYRNAQRRAEEAGFDSVDQYVENVLQQDLDDGENLDHFFTPERLAHLDRAAAAIDAGQGVPAEQVREHFWRKLG